MVLSGNFRFMKKATLLFVFFVLIFGYPVKSQISSGGKPKSFELNLFDDPVETIAIHSPDLMQVSKEDSSNEEKFLPRRFCILIPVHANLQNSGTWTDLPDGSGIWRLKLKAEGALATSLYFDDFRLSKGVKLFLYDETGMQVKGGFTSLNNDKSRFFATELIYGDAVILELYCPAFSDLSSLQISDLAYAYRDIPKFDPVKGFGGSDFCEVNIGCSPEGIDWQDEKDGVVRIQVKVSGSGFWCTGSLVNNVRNDNIPYVLTADHCAFQLGHYASVADLNQWLFYFNYESQTCENPLQEPQIKSMVGATKIAQGGNRGSTGSDFFLVRLNQTVPVEYNPYFMGWSANGDVSSNGATIHHPEGDIKKVSTYTIPLVTSDWIGSGLPSHWKVFWTETVNGWGVTEGGSSGSPLLNNQGKLIGTLTGGYAACESSGNVGPDKPDYYGKFSYHWQSNGTTDTAMLKPWLDPDNTGIIQLEGKVLGADEFKIQNESINIFPNPTSGIVNFNFINFEPSDFRLVISDNLGRLIKNFNFETNTNIKMIDISEIPGGFYTVRIGFDKGWIIKKIIKLN
jgi:hypothetical protein